MANLIGEIGAKGSMIRYRRRNGQCVGNGRHIKTVILSTGSGGNYPEYGEIYRRLSNTSAKTRRKTHDLFYLELTG